MSLQPDEIQNDDDLLTTEEALEQARHIVAQGAEAGCSAEQIHDAYMTIEASRGALAGSPETLPCYDCTREAGLSVMDDEAVIRREVIALGPVVNPADPTQSYKLACGHTVI